ncbi:hypothetical protein GGH95_005268, partial [Coemansia sp. RSA 1836]
MKVTFGVILAFAAAAAAAPADIQAPKAPEMDLNMGYQLINAYGPAAPAAAAPAAAAPAAAAPAPYDSGASYNDSAPQPAPAP